MVDRKLVEGFWKFVDSLSDEKKDVFEVIDYLNGLLRTKTTIPPTVEIVTVLKRRKPILFQFVKKSIAPSSPLQLIMNLEMDYDEAVHRLNQEEVSS